MSRWKMSIVALGVASGLSAQAQTPAAAINLARHCQAVVYASGVNGSRDVDDQFYGVQNAFDGGQHIINGINYSSWLGEETPQWVQIRFLAPTTVEKIVVTTDPSPATASPDAMQIVVTSQTNRARTFPAVKVGAPSTTYEFPRPLESPAVIRINFSSQRVKMFGILEIEVMGQPSAECKSTESTPGIDEEYRQKLKTEAAQQAAPLDPAKALARMKIAHAKLVQARLPHEQATRWLELNRVADQLARTMIAASLNEQEAQRYADAALALNNKMTYCEPSGSWLATPDGYRRYLDIWPNGPSADEAWWKTNMEGCGDFEGSAEEYQESIALHKKFLALFPASSYAKRATDQLRLLEQELRALQLKQEAKPQKK